MFAARTLSHMADDGLGVVRARDPQQRHALETNAALHVAESRALEALCAAAREKTRRLDAERLGMLALSEILAQQIERAERLAARAKPTTARPAPTTVAPFTATLCKILAEDKSEVHCHWSDDGERVVFVDADAFARDVCPRYFRHSKWTSFARMLNMYEFRKARDGVCCLRCDGVLEYNSRLDALKLLHDMEPGDAIFHSRYCFHKGEPFDEGDTKLRYSIRYMPADARLFDNTNEVAIREKGLTDGAPLAAAGEYYPQVWPKPIRGERWRVRLGLLCKDRF